MPRKYIPKPPVKCKICGELIAARTQYCQPRNGERQSMCQREAHNKHNRGYWRNKEKLPPVLPKCRTCGKQLDSHKRKFCAPDNGKLVSKCRRIDLKKRFPDKPLPKCRICGTQLEKYQHRYCLPKDGERKSECQKKGGIIVTKKRYKGKEIIKSPVSIFITKTKKVTCLKCDKIFNGHTGNRICPKCTEFNNLTPVREPNMKRNWFVSSKYSF